MLYCKGKMKGLKMKQLFLLMVFSLFAALLTGCASYDYDGETFESLKSNTPVTVWVSPEQYDGVRKKIGVLKFVSRSGANATEIRNDLRNYARKHGADAVMIVTMKRVKSGQVREDQLRNEAAPGWVVEDDSATSNQYMNNSLLYSSGKDPDKQLYKTFVTADLYRK